jgi:hypothetical protein
MDTINKDTFRIKELWLMKCYCFREGGVMENRGLSVFCREKTSREIEMKSAKRWT